MENVELGKERKPIKLNILGGREESEALTDTISVAKIKELITSYAQRKQAEECDMMTTLGGDTGIMRSLKTDREHGISGSASDISQRIIEYGSNKPEEEKLKHFCVHVWEALGDIFLQILIGAAIIQIVLGATITDGHENGWIDGMSIVVAIIVVVCIGSITNYQKDKKFKELNDTNNALKKYMTIRNGETMSLSPDDLVVGDLVEIQGGMDIPTDGLLVVGSIKTDESPITGESLLQEKEVLSICLKLKDDAIRKNKGGNDHGLPSPIIYSGTPCADGKGKFVVLAVGEHSVAGEIRMQVKQNEEAEDSKTPLEEKLNDIAGQVGYFGLSSAVITLIALFIQFGVNYSSKSSAFEHTSQKNQLLSAFASNYPNAFQNLTIANLTDPQTQVSGSILNIFLLCVAIIVVAIPEGLPLAVTLALAFSINKMMKDNNLVRKLQACETMGGANFICSDKTGTLTKNMMSVFEVYNGESVVNLADVTDDKSRKDPRDKFKNANYYNTLKMAVILNIDITASTTEEKIEKANKSDQAPIDLFEIFGENIVGLRNQYLGSDVKMIAFSSERKRMTTFAKYPESPTGYRMFVKGAPEILLDFCKYYIDPNTSEFKILSDSDKSNLDGKVIKEMCKKTLRTLAVAYKDITEVEYNEKFANEEAMTLVAIFGLMDRLRPEVPKAVSQCHKAGITVVMVTGDSKETAVAISKSCGIIPETAETDNTNIAMTGPDFWERIGGMGCKTCNKKVEECKCPKTKSQAQKLNLSEKSVRKDYIRNFDEFSKIAREIRIIARCRPHDKYALVLGLREMENVVAVTGDGTNDAMALSKSDVGFAMGIQGTDIAKTASDIIIMNDNFASIVTAVKWGRNIFDNIRKFIQFQLAVNICACLLVFITACIGNETPLSPIQMLWLNLIMDSLGSLALATEPPNDELLNRKPYGRKEKIINSLMWKHILVQSINSLGLLLFLYMCAPYFIIEDDASRIAEYEKIIQCYGLSNFPGKTPVQNADGTWKYYLIHGSSSMWPSNVSVLPGCVEYSSYANLALAFKNYAANFGSTSHMTIIFNTFVLYTLFNQMNARVIDDKFNIFYRISSNWLFLAVCFAELGLQILLIQIGSSAFKVSYNGLTLYQWGLCVAFASYTFLVSILTKFSNLEKFIEYVFSLFSNKKSAKVGNASEEPDKDNSEDKIDANNDMEANLNPSEKGGNSKDKKRGGIAAQLIEKKANKNSQSIQEQKMRDNSNKF